MSKDSRYARRGVSSGKEDVHKAIAHLDKGLFPQAFCKIIPDHLTGDDQYGLVMHADTAGTKPSLAYIYWKETGDLSVFKGIVQDALVMNLDDMLCVGARGPFLISSVIGRNKRHITGEVVQALIGGTEELCSELRSMGVEVHLTGGETADVGDIIRTLDVGITAVGRVRRDEVISVNPQPGDVIVGVASYGQTRWEKEYNGGMGSNGLTSARHDVFGPAGKGALAKLYPESFDPGMDPELVYSGSKKLTDIEPETGLSYGKLVLSPTRTYAPLLLELFQSPKFTCNGIIHCTGGAHTKVLHFAKGVRIIKDDLLPVPPIFRAIQEESGTSWEEMFKVFNMGQRLEIYLRPEKSDLVLDVCKKLRVEARIIGRVEAAQGPAQIQLKSTYGDFEYAGK